MDDIDWRDMPLLRKVGRYTFFAICSVGLTMVAYALCKGAIGLDKYPAHSVSSLAGLIAFIALRDMSKQWDWVLEQQAQARADRRAA